MSIVPFFLGASSEAGETGGVAGGAGGVGALVEEDGAVSPSTGVPGAVG